MHLQTRRRPDRTKSTSATTATSAWRRRTAGFADIIIVRALHSNRHCSCSGWQRAKHAPADGIRAAARTEPQHGSTGSSRWMLLAFQPCDNIRQAIQQAPAISGADAGLFRKRVQHAGAIMAAPVFEELVRRSRTNQRQLMYHI